MPNVSFNAVIKICYTHSNTQLFFMKEDNYNNIENVGQKKTFLQQNCSMNSNFSLRTTVIKCPHASMCMDNPTCI